MYIPPHFTFDDDEEIQELIRRWPLATVVVHGSDGLAANHIPLIIEQEQTGLILHGHIARANPLSRIDDETPALAVFQGPSAYISPSWYATKQQHGKVVPTWNYSAVHVSGTLTVIDNAEWTLSMVTRLTEMQESSMSLPWQVSDAPTDFTQALLKSIVGIELRVADLQAKKKASQNQPEENRYGVQQGLQAISNPFAEELSGHE